MSGVEPSASQRQAAAASVSEASGASWTGEQPDAFDSAKRAPAYLHGHLKRTLDLAVAMLLLLLLAPLMTSIAVAIRVTSPGPALFRQRRCGRNGKPFTILKFRSMYVEPAAIGPIVQASRNDPRITWLGAILRKSSLDELPQFINVLRGDMSLVGPRPHALSQDESYVSLVPQYARRYSVRPGITGLAQVSGARGETPALSDMKRRVHIDLIYIRDASLALDLKILAGTARELFVSDQAY